MAEIEEDNGDEEKEDPSRVAVTFSLKTSLWQKHPQRSIFEGQRAKVLAHYKMPNNEVPFLVDNDWLMKRMVAIAVTFTEAALMPGSRMMQVLGLQHSVFLGG